MEGSQEFTGGKDWAGGGGLGDVSRELWRGLGGGWGVLGGNGAGALRHPGLSLGGLPAHTTQTAARELEPRLLIPWGPRGPPSPEELSSLV